MMKSGTNQPRSRLWLAAVLAALALGCSPSVPDESNATRTAPTDGLSTTPDDALVQFSLLAALAAGDYGGGVPLSEIREHGDFGLGTFDRLDGEMIVLDGEVYQVLSDGKVRRRDDEGSTPFATVTFFGEDGRFDAVAAKSLAELDHWFDRRLPKAQVPVAIRVQGTFEHLTLRSAAAQKPPYRPLVEAIDQQVTWERQNVRGTLIGFRCPEWMGTLNVAGYHWHFLSDDRAIGGHVLDCQFSGATAVYDECDAVSIRLPSSESFGKVDMSDVSDADVDKIERQRKAE